MATARKAEATAEEVKGFEDTLRTTRGIPNSGHLNAWLLNPKNSRALSFVRAWLRLQAAGESFWSSIDVVAHLKAEFGMPASFAKDCIKGWLSRHEYLKNDPDAEIQR